MSNPILIQALIDLLQKELVRAGGSQPNVYRDMQAAVGDDLLRDIVRDQRRPPISPSEPAARVRDAAAPRVVTGSDGAGWTNTPSIDNWRPPGQRYADALFDAEDAKWKADRAAEFAKLGKAIAKGSGQ